MDEFPPKDSPQQKELLFSDASDLVVHEIELEDGSQCASASDKPAASPNIISDVSLTSENENPWPYITKYYQFKGLQGGNILFECIQCLPTRKVISASRRSRSSLKKHLRCKHSRSLKKFEDCIVEGKKAFKMKKRQASSCEGNNKKQKGMQQLTLLDATPDPSIGKVISVATLEDRIIDVFVENVLPHNNNLADGSSVNSNISLALENENPWPCITKYFQFKGHKGGNVLFECLQCLPVHKVISTSRKSRNNLRKHVRIRHGHSLKEFDTCFWEGSKRKRRPAPYDTGDNEKKQVTLLDTTADTPRGKSVSQATFEDRLVNVFIENLLPLHIVESESFKSLLQLVPGNHSVSVSSLTGAIEARFQSKKERLKDILQKLSSVATTADAWTCRNRSYIGMTVHWIDQATFKRRRAFLACQRLRGRHTHDVVKAIHDIHCSFGIENKVSWITTDNGSSFIKAVTDYGTQESADDQEDEDSGDVVQVEEMAVLLEEQAQDKPGNEPYILPKHSRCAAQTLNLIATTDADKAFDKCPDYKKANQSAFAKAEELWNKQHRSSQASDTIKEEVENVLVIPTVTRWNFVYDGVVHLVDIFDNEDMLKSLQKACNSLKIPCFTADDMAFLREYRRVMEPVAKALNILQEEQWAYRGTLLPTLAICLKTLKEQRNSSNISVCQPLVEALIDGIMKRFSHLFDDMEYLLSTALNPKFKLAFWPEWLIDDALSVEEMKDRVTSQLISLLEETNNEEGTESTTGNEHEAEQSKEGKDKVEDYFEALYGSSNKRKETEKLVRSFLEERPEKGINIYTFPCKALLNLSIRFNTPIPSSAAVEGLLAMGKDVLKPKRAGLSDDHFRMLVFLIGNQH